MRVLIFLAVFVQLSTCADLPTLLATPVENNNICISFKIIPDAFGGKTPRYVQFRSIFSPLGREYLELKSQVLFE